MIEKREARLRRKERVRQKINGTAERPRLAVFKSLAHFYAQAIDDEKGETLVGLSTLAKDFSKNGGNVKGAHSLGELFAKKAKTKKISEVVFDRGGFAYHGRVKAFAEAVRQGGIKF